MALRFFRNRRVPFIPQMEAVECGAASLAMILGYHGHHAPLVEVRQACGVSRDGVNALAILTAARSWGLEAEAVRLELEHLDDLVLPAILHWGFNHFLVLERLRGKRALIVDPAGGRRWVGFEELNRCFTGVALVFAPGDDFKFRARQRPSLARYRTLFGTCVPSLAQILGASLMIQLCGMVFPVANQLLLDRVIGPKQEPWLWGLAFGMGTALIAKSALSLVRSWVIQNVQVHMDRALMGQFMEHMLHLPLSFFLQRKPGDLLQRVQGNTALRNIFASRSVSGILDFFLMLGYALLLVAYRPTLGLLVIAFGMARLALLAGLRRTSQQLMSAEMAANGKEGAALLEALTALETMKATRAEVPMTNRWVDRMTARANITFQRRRIEVALNQSVWLLQGVATATVFWIGGQEVMSERMTLGVFSAFIALQSLFLGPLESLMGSLMQLQYVGTQLQRLDDVMSSERELSGTQDPGQLTGRIQLEDVCFAYSPGAPSVVSNLSISISPGEKVALVGPSGAGKSTVARLLLGMHLPDSGTIRFDGLDLRALDLTATRRQMGVVMQDTFLLNDSIRANLALNDPDLPEESIRMAASRACILDTIKELPEGFDTVLGENGSRLSGGQRQRLSLARALAHEPAILLLDEATSSLDLETEAKVHRNLAAFGCTRIVIAHRLATVRDADRILVLSQGSLVQEGRFEELAAQPGIFQQLIETMEASHG